LPPCLKQLRLVFTFPSPRSKIYASSSIPRSPWRPSSDGKGRCEGLYRAWQKPFPCDKTLSQMERRYERSHHLWTRVLLLQLSGRGRDLQNFSTLSQWMGTLSHIFFGVPLTTKIKQNPYYLSIRFKDREQCVMLSQLRLWDGKRLTHKMGQLPDDQFEAVKQALRRLLK